MVTKQFPTETQKLKGSGSQTMGQVKCGTWALDIHTSQIQVLIQRQHFPGPDGRLNCGELTKAQS